MSESESSFSATVRILVFGAPNEFNIIPQSVLFRAERAADFAAKCVHLAGSTYKISLNKSDFFSPIERNAMELYVDKFVILNQMLTMRNAVDEEHCGSSI